MAATSRPRFWMAALSMPKLRKQSDEDAIAAITSVKGLGVWSAEVFLLFSLQRPDVLPAHDLGLIVAAQRMKRLKERPEPQAAARDRRAVATLSLLRLAHALALLPRNAGGVGHVR